MSRPAVKRAFSLRAPALRTVAPAYVPRRNARGERRDQGRARWSMTYGPTSCRPTSRTARRLDERFASTHGRLRRRHHAPLIGERAATLGRSATGGGDERAATCGLSSGERDARRYYYAAGPVWRPAQGCGHPGWHRIAHHSYPAYRQKAFQNMRFIVSLFAGPFGDRTILAGKPSDVAMKA